ncbi:MAG TPA: hypothetical protein VMT51_14080 [Dongiaceae bacterium]|nr:hypothetical protein [Dongiaceae bacterium]
MRKPLLTAALFLPLLAGCQSAPKVDYLPLAGAGMLDPGVDALKKLKVSNAEIDQVAALKSAGVSDDMCVALVAAARSHGRSFNSADAAKNLNRAGFTDEQILALAKRDQLDSLASDAVVLKLIGLSPAAVQTILHRRMDGVPTLSSAEIGRLKNTQLSEREIMARIESGMTDAQADAEAAARENGRAHHGTGFTRVHGRRR